MAFTVLLACMKTLFEVRVSDEIVDCSLEFIKVREYGFVSSTVAFAKARMSSSPVQTPWFSEAEVGNKGQGKVFC